MAGIIGIPGRLQSVQAADFVGIRRDNPSKADSVTIAAIEAGVPKLVEAREIIAKFHSMIRQKAVAYLAPWITRARHSLVASFGSGDEKAAAKFIAEDRNKYERELLAARDRESTFCDALANGRLTG